MYHLLKLAESILNASHMENKIIENSQSDIKSKSKANETSPTREEQNRHERSISFGEEIDFSVEPTVEYLD